MTAPDDRPWGPPPPYPPPPYPPPPYPPPGRPGGSGGTRVAIAVVAAVVLLAVAVLVPVLVLASDDEAEPGASPSTGSGSDPAPVDLSDVQVFDDLPTTHVDDDVDYEQVPPAGGEHVDEWLDCGVYDVPVRDEHAVHDLEHGTVWITYDPGAVDDEGVAALAEQLPQNGIMSPYDGLPAPVVVTVWGAQLALTGPGDPRLPLFVEEYDDGVTAPEPTASCAGGTASGSGGVSA